MSISDVTTLLMNGAYMFCTYGQGVLYITDSGQQLQPREEVFEPIVVDSTEHPITDDFLGDGDRDSATITQIIVHHTGMPVHNDGIWDALGEEEQWIPMYTYHERGVSI